MDKEEAIRVLNEIMDHHERCLRSIDGEWGTGEGRLDEDDQKEMADFKAAIEALK